MESERMSLKDFFYLYLTPRIQTKDHIGNIDVQSQINQPKELLTTGPFCVLLRQSARKHSVSYPLHPNMRQSDILGGGNFRIIM